MNNHFYVNSEGILNSSRPSLTQSHFHLDIEVSLDESNTSEWHAAGPNFMGTSFIQDYSFTSHSFSSEIESVWFVDKPKETSRNILSEPKLPNI